MKISGVNRLEPLNPVNGNLPGTSNEPERNAREKPLPPQEADAPSVETKVEEVNKVLETLRHNARFQIVNVDGRTVLQLVQKEGGDTGPPVEKVIYQIPPEGIFKVSHKIKEMVGLVIDKKW